MTTSEPPRFSTWLLERLAPRRKRDSLIGDFREHFHDGRSAWWYRRQVFTTVAASVGADIGGHKLRAVFAFLTAYASFFVFSVILGVSRQTLFIDWDLAPQHPEILRQAVVYYGLPFAVVMCIALAAAGWAIARWHRHGGAGMVILSAWRRGCRPSRGRGEPDGCCTQACGHFGTFVWRCSLPPRCSLSAIRCAFSWVAFGLCAMASKPRRLWSMLIDERMPRCVAC